MPLKINPVTGKFDLVNNAGTTTSSTASTLAFGTTEIPLSDTAPDPVQYLQYDGTTIVGASPVGGIGTIVASTNLTGGTITTAGTIAMAGTIQPTMIGTTTMQGGTINAVVIGSPTINSGTATSIALAGTTDLTGGQIKFPATQVPSADANTLDDYEEGTWTPVLTFGTPGDLSISYTFQVGKYVKIGKLVIAYFFIYSTSFTHSTGSGNVKITGLPFTSADSCTGDMDWQGITKTNYTHFYPILIAGNTFLNIVGGGSGQLRAYVQAADMPSGDAPFLRGMIIYFV